MDRGRLACPSKNTPIRSYWSRARRISCDRWPRNIVCKVFSFVVWITFDFVLGMVLRLLVIVLKKRFGVHYIGRFVLLHLVQLSDADLIWLPPEPVLSHPLDNVFRDPLLILRRFSNVKRTAIPATVEALSVCFTPWEIFVVFDTLYRTVNGPRVAVISAMEDDQVVFDVGFPSRWPSHRDLRKRPLNSDSLFYECAAGCMFKSRCDAFSTEMWLWYEFRLEIQADERYTRHILLTASRRKLNLDYSSRSLGLAIGVSKFLRQISRWTVTW